MLNHLGTLELETERLLLRKIYIGDVDDAYEWESNPEVNKYLYPGAREKTYDVVESLVKHWNYMYKDKEFYHWGIELRETKKLIGHISLAESGADITIGYTASQKYWNNGYITEALQRVVSFLLDDVGYEYINAYHMIQNESSGRVLLKSGFEYSGIVNKDFGGGYPTDAKKYVIRKNIVKS